MKFIKAEKIESTKSWNNYQAVWEINQGGVQKNMLEIYKKEKTKILQDFYKEMGSYFDDKVDLNKVHATLNT